MDKANHSRTRVSVPRPPTPKKCLALNRSQCGISAFYVRFLREDVARRPPSYLWGVRSLREDVARRPPSYLVGKQRTPLFGGNKYLNTLRLKLKYLDFSIRVSILPVV